MPVSTRKRSYLATTNVNDIIASKGLRVEPKHDTNHALKQEIKEECLDDDLNMKPDDIRKSLETTPDVKKPAAATIDNEERGSRTWYERLREENLKANAAFLASLNMNEVKNSFASSIGKSVQPKKPKKTSERGIKMEKQAVAIEPREYQLRPRDTLKLRSASLQTEGVEEDILVSLPIHTRSSRVRLGRTKSGTSHRGVGQVVKAERNKKERNLEEILSWEDNCQNKETAGLDSLIKRVERSDSQSCQLLPDLYDDFIDCCKSLTINENRVAKVTPKRIFSIAIHGGVDQSPLVAAGDKWGYIGLWNVEPDVSEAGCDPENSMDTDDGVSLFKPHTSPVNCIEFSPHDYHIFHSVSYDGTLRRCDINKQTFSLAYHTKEARNYGLMYLTYVDSHTVAVAQYNGTVTLVDERSNKPVSYMLTGARLKAIDFHPVHRDYFLTGSVEGDVDVYDRRLIKTKGTKPISTAETDRGILSAYFSPVTGDQILSCSADNTIRVLDSRDLHNVKQKKRIAHNNHTGRWVTNFRATWLPCKEECCFLIGALKHPRQIELYNVNGSVIHRFHDDGENLSCITSVHAFHPRQPILVGGNASGRCYVFKN